MRALLVSCLVAATALACAQVRIVAHFKHEESAAAKAEEAKAKQLFQIAMGRQPTVNVRAILFQRVDYSSNVMQQIKVEMTRSGKLHQIVLAPLSWQGTELVDDGVSTRTYSPDDRTLVIQPSARQEPDDVQFRMSLVDKNYDLKIDRKEKIAGRSAIVIAAVPKNDDLETRCYAIDDKTGFLLRLETCREGHKPKLHFEAKMVEFPSSIPDSAFHLDAAFAKVTQFSHKDVDNSTPALARELGFRPVLPNSLPYGFAIQELQAASDASLPALAVRVTDGLGKATVYQWRHGNRRSSAPEGTLVATAGQVTLLISGDLPDEVKDRILDAFVKAARSERAFDIPMQALSWAQELGCDLSVFPLDRDTNEVARTILAIPVYVRP